MNFIFSTSKKTKMKTTDNSNIVAWFDEKLLNCKQYLKHDVGQLDMKKDPMQTLSFMRGQQAAFCMSRDKLLPLIESYAEMVKWVIELRKIASTEIPEFNIPELNSAIEKANNITKTIK